MTKEEIQAEAILKKNWPYDPENLQNFKDAMKFTYQAIIDSMVEMQAAAAPVADSELVLFAQYIQECIKEGGLMTYPQHKAAVEAWRQTMARFGAAAPVGEWIAVSDRLPEAGVYPVKVTSDTSDVIMYGVGLFSAQGFEMATFLNKSTISKDDLQDKTQEKIQWLYEPPKP